GGSAGEHQHGQIVGVTVDDGGRVGREQVVEHDRPGQVDADRLDDDLEVGQLGPVDVGEGLRRGRGHHDGARAGAAELVLQLGRRRLRVERHHHQAGTEAGEVPGHEVPVVAGQQRDAVARLEAQAGQSTAEGSYLV